MTAETLCWVQVYIEIDKLQDLINSYHAKKEYHFANVSSVQRELKCLLRVCHAVVAF